MIVGESYYLKVDKFGDEIGDFFFMVNFEVIVNLFDSVCEVCLGDEGEVDIEGSFEVMMGENCYCFESLFDGELIIVVKVNVIDIFDICLKLFNFD